MKNKFSGKESKKLAGKKSNLEKKLHKLREQFGPDIVAVATIGIRPNGDLDLLEVQRYGKDAMSNLGKEHEKTRESNMKYIG